jgi:hypothetical protein
MSIEGLLEDSIIADLQRDPDLQHQTIRKHDYGGAIAGDDQLTEPESESVIVVTATDRGEFKMGSGIRNLNVEVQIRVNGDADNFNGTLLDSLTEKVRLRLMPSPFASGVTPFREAFLSNGSLKIYGITNQDATQRTESGFERIRTVPATFIAAQIS